MLKSSRIGVYHQTDVGPPGGGGGTPIYKSPDVCAYVSGF